jgi:endonuclease/exonuclease/phosphatase family metal-dependent hydrolase
LKQNNSFQVFDPHFLANGGNFIDPNDEVTRMTQLKILLDFIKDKNIDNLPVIIAGDFNSNDTSYSNGVTQTINNNSYTDTALTSITKQNYSYRSLHVFTTALTDSLRIDHIYGSKEIQAQNFKLLYGTPSSYPSDHFGISSTVSIYYQLS